MDADDIIAKYLDAGELGYANMECRKVNVHRVEGLAYAYINEISTHVKIAEETGIL
jgi:hypothetical protein